MLTADLPDLNVWLALVWPLHPQHLRARHYWEQEAADRVLFCTATALGLVRLLSSSLLMGDGALSTVAAGALLEQFCQQPGVGLGGESTDGWEVFQALLRKGNVAPDQVVNAHLAAAAIVNGWRLVTLDGGFDQFVGLKLLRL